MTKNVIINDVGPRDGLQTQGKILTVEERVRLIKALVAAGIPSIEVGSFVSPKAVPAMADTDQVFAALSEIGSVDFQALIPNRRGYDMAKSAGVGAATLVVAATETMNEKNINSTVEASIATAGGVIQQALLDGIKPYACVAVAWECPFEGKTDPAAVKKLVKEFFAMGAMEVVLADTIGAANPGSVYDLMAALADEHGGERLSCHFHDTRAMGVANAYAALRAGIRKFDASIGGLGGCPFAPGATGNVATEDLVMMLEQMGYTTGIDLPLLMQAGQLAGELTGSETGGRADKWRRLQLEKNRPLI